jgi:hypothetical protein
MKAILAMLLLISAALAAATLTADPAHTIGGVSYAVMGETAPKPFAGAPATLTVAFPSGAGGFLGCSGTSWSYAKGTSSTWTFLKETKGAFSLPLTIEMLKTMGYTSGMTTTADYSIRAVCMSASGTASEADTTAKLALKVGEYYKGYGFSSGKVGDFTKAVDGKCEFKFANGCKLRNTSPLMCNTGDEVAYAHSKECVGKATCKTSQGTLGVVCRYTGKVAVAFPSDDARARTATTSLMNDAYWLVDGVIDPLVIALFLLALVMFIEGALRDTENTKRLLKWD